MNARIRIEQRSPGTGGKGLWVLLLAVLVALAALVTSQQAYGQGAGRSGKEVVDTQKTVGGLKIFLGITAAESLLAYPADSIERTMHGGVPKGSGYYHLNVSLYDRVSNAPITDAVVEVRIERPGMGGESKTLEPIPLGAASYGSYVKVMRKTPYQIIVRIRTANSPGPVEARFERSFN